MSLPTDGASKIKRVLNLPQRVVVGLGVIWILALQILDRERYSGTPSHRFFDATLFIVIVAILLWIFRSVPSHLSQREIEAIFRRLRWNVKVSVWYAGMMTVLAIVLLLTTDWAESWDAILGLLLLYAPVLATSTSAHVCLKRRRRLGLWLLSYTALVWILTPFFVGFFFITVPLLRRAVFIGRLPCEAWIYDPRDEGSQRTARA
ncbi:MAG: hypothetical protein H8E44_11590 [Planctomycetes bacterium]|nr:hypothetical protein [Planctomycetota bacterium]MBL7038544.1 hypothetical protein [Pirellulaceae bacterium]